MLKFCNNLPFTAFNPVRDNLIDNEMGKMHYGTQGECYRLPRGKEKRQGQDGCKGLVK